VTVRVGGSRLFELKRPVNRLFLANPAIATVRFLDLDKPEPRILDIYGLSFGRTTLTIWDDQEKPTTLSIQVTIDTRDLERRIGRLLPGSDIQVDQLGPQVILSGQVPDAKTMSEVLQLVQASLVGEASSLPVASPAGGGGGAGAGPTRLSGTDPVRRAGFDLLPQNTAQQPTGGQVPAPPVPGTGAPEVQNGPTGSAAPFMGSGDSMQAVDGSFAALPVGGQAPMTVATQRNILTVSPRAGGGLLPPGTIVNRVRVPGPRQVLLKVKIAELNRTALREFGANFQSTIIGNNILNSVIGNLGTTNSQLFGIFDSNRFTIYLNALRQNNLARLLAEPNLVAMDGQPARFLAGGSFPFPVPQAGINGANVITIQFRDFGAILQFIPHIVDDDTIRLDVEPSFSELNFAAGITVNGTTVPGLDQRSARTVVEIREGQTLAMAGLLSTRTSAQTERVPLIGDLPVIGPFFSNNQITTTETELVVLVTPQFADSLEPNEVPPAPGDWYQEPNDCEFYLLGRIEGRTGQPFRATIQELDPFEVMKHQRSESHWVVGPHGYGD
jgi:pilus assembly protein CpaC